jgi:hypothetical protein
MKHLFVVRTGFEPVRQLYISLTDRTLKRASTIPPPDLNIKPTYLHPNTQLIRNCSGHHYSGRTKTCDFSVLYLFYNSLLAIASNTTLFSSASTSSSSPKSIKLFSNASLKLSTLIGAPTTSILLS